jgi:uncharacterized protein (TIGR02284 family)
MDTTDLVDRLNGLIAACKDAEHEFTRYAGYVESGEIGDFLFARSQSLRMAARELQALVAGLGGKPRDAGTAGAALRRGSGFPFERAGSDNDPSMLEACEYGEAMALERYGAVLGGGLPPQLRLIIQRQYKAADRSHQTLGAIRYQEQLESV